MHVCGQGHTLMSSMLSEHLQWGGQQEGEPQSQGVRTIVVCGCPMQTTVHALPAKEHESAKLGAEPSQRQATCAVRGPGPGAPGCEVRPLTAWSQQGLTCACPASTPL